MKLTLVKLRSLVKESVIDASDRFAVSRAKANWKRSRQAGYDRTRDERVEEIANLCATTAMAALEREVEAQDEDGKHDLKLYEQELKVMHERVVKIVKATLRYGLEPTK